MAEKVSEDVQQLLTTVFDHFENEDKAVRERQIRTWKQLKLFWFGIQRTWYSEVAHDWRIGDSELFEDSSGQQADYDRPVNIFRAYLESIIAALSVTVPPIKCYPDDADSTLDLSTARNGDKIAQLIYRHNDAQLLWLHALYIYCTEGMMACYSYPKAKDEYGTYEKKQYENVEEEHQYARCPECGYDMEDNVISETFEGKLKQNENKFNPGPEDVPVQDYIAEDGTDWCPSCGQQIIPQLVNESLIVTRLVGQTTEPKSRVCLETYGGLYVKISNYARSQAECPYLRYSYETNYVNSVEEFPDLEDSKLKAKLSQNPGPSESYEAYARLSPQYNGEYPRDIVTMRHGWYRPCAFNCLPEKEDRDKLKKLYPNGVHITFVNDEFAHAENSALDDCWTLTYNPMADYVHFDPLGLLLVSVQEIINDLLSLTLQTVEHGIPQTFADPSVLNFNAYRQLEATPGGIYEATPKSGKTLRDAFHEVKTASLSGEVLPFSSQVQSLGQLVSGALPSLFGGSIEGSETASQYSMSRAQALQRLQNVWKMLTKWWKDIFGKAIPMYIQLVEEDERDVERTKDGNFVNVFIRKSELEGKIGKVELEANENLPITWNQRKDVVMQLLTAGVPEVLALLGAPENLPIIREAIGLDNFFVPGEDYVEKTYEDIKLLLNSQPIMDPESGQEIPSVEVDPLYAEPSIQFEIVRKWVVSEAGSVAKIENQEGYRNVLLYGQYLKMVMSMNEAPPEAQGAQEPQEQPNPSDSRAPITGEENVQVTA